MTIVILICIQRVLLMEKSEVEALKDQLESQ